MNKAKTYYLFIIVLCLISLIFTSCARSRLYATRNKEEIKKLNEAWKEKKTWPKIDKLDYQIPNYAEYLKGMKICLDPGHGGDVALKGYKRGPSEVREAVMDLKVANYLKGFLEKAGAQVILTRDKDVDVTLEERCRIANEAKVDLFLSIHHNAIGNPKINYTTTWFHADPDYQPANLDFARYIQQGVADALRLPQVNANPLKSDYLMYPGSGFGVLRPLKVVGCLCEASFFTNPYEEYRLSKDWYLKREAYGHFLGIARYVWAGIPKAYLTEPAADTPIPSKIPVIKLKADTGFYSRKGWAADKPWIFSDSVIVKLDGKKIPSSFDSTTGIITTEVKEPLLAGEHIVIGGFRNYNGNYSHPIEQKFIIDPPVDKLVLTVSPDKIPPDKNALARIMIEAIDKDGLPVLDGTVVEMLSTAGDFENPSLKTKNGKAIAYLSAPEKTEKVKIVARSKEKFGEGYTTIAEIKDKAFLYGIVNDAISNQPIQDAKGTLNIAGIEENYVTEQDGRFVSQVGYKGKGTLTYMKKGYYDAKEIVELEGNKATKSVAKLYPVFDGALSNKIIIVDPRFGGSEKGDVDSKGISASEYNLMLGQLLKKKLEEAGVEVSLTRNSDESIPAEKRVESANKIKDANLYLRLDHRKYQNTENGFLMEIYPNSDKGKKITEAVDSQAEKIMDLKNIGNKGINDVEIMKTEMLSVSAVPYTLDNPQLKDYRVADTIEAEANAIIRGLAVFYGWNEKEKKELVVKLNPTVPELLKNKWELKLDGAETALVKYNGEYKFEPLPIREYRIDVIDESGNKVGTYIADIDKNTKFAIDIKK